MKVKEIESLIAFIAKSGLEEVRIETEQIKLSIKKNMPVLQQVVPELPSDTVPATATQNTPLSVSGGKSAHDSHVEIKAPMVGTFYQALKPDAPPLVREGDYIQQGQKLCVIEAMKLFNEIEADISGTIVKVLVDDASPVEYDQPLFLVSPGAVIDEPSK